MNIVDKFGFPQQILMDLPITKVALKNNDDATLSDRRLLDNPDIQSIRMKAIIKQETANIPPFQSEDESYLEVYCVDVILQAGTYEKYYKKIAHLLHKLIPHHLIIIIQSDDHTMVNFSLATKSISKNSEQLRVIQNEFYTEKIDFENESFLEALHYENANKQNLKTLYNYYIMVAQNYNLIDVTQKFQLRTYEQTGEMLTLQEEIEAYQTQINQNIKQLTAATQMSEKVQLNTDIHTLKTKIEELKNTLLNYGKDQ